MRLSKLTQLELRNRLRIDGLRIRVGGYVFAIRSPLAIVAEAIEVLYADFPLATDEPFADFHVSIDPRRRLRRWKQPETIFSVAGHGAFSPFPAAMTVAYLEWGMNWCVSNLAHHRLVIHSSTLERNGHGIIIAGKSGAGKSTLAAGLALDGWRLLSDEYALLSPEDLRLDALARPISLKGVSIGLISARDPAAVWGPRSLGDPRGEIRHLRPRPEWIERSTETAEPAWLLLLDFQQGVPARLQRAAKGATMMQMIAHSFNYYTLGLRGFDTLAALVDRCECYRFTYGDLDNGIALLGKLSASAEAAHAK